MSCLLLFELLSGLYLKVYTGQNFSAATTDITGINTDSRTVHKGQIFAAIKGYRQDGKDFKDEAYERGARVFLTEEIFSVKEDCAIIKCKNVRKTLAEISAKLNDNPHKKLVLIGVTGTKGKTTVAYSVSRLMSIMGVKTYCVGTLGVTDENGDTIMHTENTTPDSIKLFSILSDALFRGAEAVVIEASSQALKDYRLYGITFCTVVFTSLGYDHIGKCEHASFEEYLNAKRMLFTSFGAKIAVANGDDPFCDYMTKSAEKCIKCGFSSVSDFKITKRNAKYYLNGIEISKKELTDYNAINFSLAIAVCNNLYGFSCSELIEHLSEITLPGRMEIIEAKGRFFIIDYAHNEMSFRAVISYARSKYDGRVIVVYGSVGDRCSKRRKALARVAEQLADFSVITSDDSVFEDPAEICAEIYSYYTEKAKAEIVTDREAAIYRAFSISERGDTILLLGKGHERYIKSRSGVKHFSEPKIIDNIKNIAPDTEP